MKTKIRRDAKTKDMILTSYKSWKGTTKDFCKSIGLPIATYYKWKAEAYKAKPGKVKTFTEGEPQVLSLRNGGAGITLKNSYPFPSSLLDGVQEPYAREIMYNEIISTRQCLNDLIKVMLGIMLLLIIVLYKTW